MYLGHDLVLTALEVLKDIHPFYGTTFLACKRHHLTVGTLEVFQIAAAERAILDEYYDLFPASKYYFRAFRISDKKSFWVDKKKYPTSTLQSTRTQSEFQHAFLHIPGTSVWSWTPDYAEILSSLLDRNAGTRKEKIPIFWIAVWLFRNRNFEAGVTGRQLIELFIKEFKIEEIELLELFNANMNSHVGNIASADAAVTSAQICIFLNSFPPDNTQEKDAALVSLSTSGIGPVAELLFDPGERLSIVTGDNGLGKTFLLDCIWWGLCNEWISGLPYVAPLSSGLIPRIEATVASRSGKTVTRELILTSSDRRPGQRRTLDTSQEISPPLLVYARSDGQYAICHPASLESSQPYETTKLTVNEVWNGKSLDDGAMMLNGLVYDLVYWQNEENGLKFRALERVLRRLSPPRKGDIGKLRLGKPIVIPTDSRPMPSLVHEYGPVPIVYAAAGVKRILSLAYLMVWAADRHEIAARDVRNPVPAKLVLLVDEVEAHLHPKWQRKILPALLQISADVSQTESFEVQIVAVTHSPLVMASIENMFRYEVDKQFQFDLDESPTGSSVTFSEVPFVPRGLADYWLQSPTFDVSPRSVESQRAIDEATAIQLRENPDKKEIQRVSRELVQLLSDTDPFWPRWITFAASHDVDL